jgi:hypothetical protein
LMLALAECEVTKAGGSYSFCDTDSLAIVRTSNAASGIPGVSDAAVDAIVKRFNRLNPYNPKFVPNLLKVEYPQYPDLQCHAVSAKRYVLYRIRPGNRIQIVKASESGLGAIIGRSANESTPKLARRIWLSILMEHVEVNPMQRRRATPLVAFDVPLRRKFQVAQPAILERLNKTYNKDRNFDMRVKETIGLLDRLPVHSTKVKRIGKEVDRLSGDEGATLDEERPIEYVCDALQDAIAFLRRFPQAEIALALGISGRAWRSIMKSTSQPRRGTGSRITKLAGRRGSGEPAGAES